MNSERLSSEEEREALLSPGLLGAIGRYQSPKSQGVQVPRPRGRPLKLTDEYLSEILYRHGQALAWFESIYGCAPSSSLVLYTAVARHVFADRGERPSRADEPQFQSKLRTLCNELSRARRALRGRHE